MSIPGKVLIALLSALLVSAAGSALHSHLSFMALLTPTALAAVLAVVLSHRALPMPNALSNEARPAPKAPKQGRARGGNNGPKGAKTNNADKAPKKAAKAKSTSKGARETGTVKWFNGSKGFGFIIRDNGEEIFVHHRSIVGEGRRSLRDGATVTFRVAETDKGPQAEDVEGDA